MRGITLLLAMITWPCWALAQPANACLSQAPQHIVVLGSSTAAGVGPSTPDSAWVNRFRRRLQSWHPDYQVSNLARGGYTTYHLMPAGFQPPPNRPQPDSLRNISAALALVPDAILINLPSNDAAQGVSVDQQLTNFRAMVQVADSQGVPVWICTPQPRLFGPPQLAMQLALRDSILVAFGSRAIDFWTGLADSLALPLPIYDAGDGVHLNDAGHALLFHRVLSAQVPDSAYRPPAGPDYLPIDLEIGGECGESRLPFRLRWANLGHRDSSGVEARLRAVSADGLVRTRTLLLAGLPGCQADTTQLEMDLAIGGEWTVDLSLSSPPDSLVHNDTLHRRLRLVPALPPLTQDLILCQGDTAHFMALPQRPGQVRWYQRLADSVPQGVGQWLPLPGLRWDTTLHVSALNDPVTWRETLTTPAQYDRSWNGIMVDLMPQRDLWLDSLRLPIAATGPQVLRLYRRSGSYLGHEQDSASWQLWDTVAFTATQTNQWQHLPLDSLPLSGGDTVGLYLHLADPNARLRYEVATETGAFSNDELKVVTGAGITHTFGQPYFPRHLPASFGYHWSAGPCESERLPVSASLANPFFSLGADTLLRRGDTMRLRGPEADRYQWSTGDSLREIAVVMGTGGSDSLRLWLQAWAGPDCPASDTLLVQVDPSLQSGLPALAWQRTFWVSRVGRQEIVLHGLRQPPDRVILLDSLGREVYRWPGQTGYSYRLPDLPAGWYWLRIQGVGLPRPAVGVRL